MIRLRMKHHAVARCVTGFATAPSILAIQADKSFRCGMRPANPRVVLAFFGSVRMAWRVVCAYDCKKALSDVLGRKIIARVSGLRNFGDDRLIEDEQVFISEQINRPGTDGQFPVEAFFVVWLPVDPRISLSSPLADKLRDASPGSVFRVSGRLFARTGAENSHLLSAGSQTDARQRFEGAQANAATNVTNLQYLAQFTDIAPANH
jgi:hypothetical protein